MINFLTKRLCISRFTLRYRIKIQYQFHSLNDMHGAVVLIIVIKQRLIAVVQLEPEVYAVSVVNVEV